MSSSSREQSPDWLHSFQGPTHSEPTVPLDSELSLSDNSSEDSDKLPISKFLHFPNKGAAQDVAVDGRAEGSSKRSSDAKSPKKLPGIGDTPSKKNSKIQKRKEGDKKVAEATFQESDKEARKFSVYAISSDYESCSVTDDKNEDITFLGETSDRKASESQMKEKGEEVCLPDTNEESPPKKVFRRKSLKQAAKIEDVETKTDVVEKKDEDSVYIMEEEMERPQKSHVSSSRLPLVLSEKVHRTKALVECEGDSIDLSGDMGAVGRVVISDTPSGDHDMYLDLKGTVYKTTINPCRTFCVVSFGQSEAKIEAIMSDYIQLTPHSDFNESETVFEGTLEGFSLDMDDEVDEMTKATPDQNGENDGNGEKKNGKTKKKANKTSGLPQKRARKTGSKPVAPAKVSKKTRVSKKPTKRK